MASRCGGSSPVIHGALLAEQPPAADAFQRPLRSRFQARLRHSVRPPPEKAGEAVRLRGIIFDLDGTLGDTIPVCIQAFQRTFHHYLGHLFTAQDIIAMFGPSEEGMLQRQLPQTWPQALDMSLVRLSQNSRLHMFNGAKRLRCFQ